MHKKYSTNGLVCISVSIDDVDEMKSTLAFLKQMNSTLANYLLDEPGELREAKLDVGPPPTVLVFDKNGKRVKKFSTEEPFTYEDVEKLAVSLLK